MSFNRNLVLKVSKEILVLAPPCSHTMHVRPAVLLVVAFALLAAYGNNQPQLVKRSLSQRDEHSHHHAHHSAPLLVLNETEVTMHHAPTPPSYYTIDWEEEGHQSRYPGLMISHGIFMSLAFFVALPIGALLSYSVRALLPF